MALTYGDYAVTEAGFGADLGAEKFYDIKCRKAGLQPDATVLVVTLQALKMHGGVPYEKIKQPDIAGAANGFWNLDKHVANLRRYGQHIIVCFNQYKEDTPDEIEEVRRHCQEELHVDFAINNAFTEGGKGAEQLAETVVKAVERRPSEPLRLLYKDDDTVESKIEAVARNIYGAGSITYTKKARTQPQPRLRPASARPAGMHCQDTIQLLHRRQVIRTHRRLPPRGLRHRHQRRCRHDRRHRW